MKNYVAQFACVTGNSYIATLTLLHFVPFDIIMSIPSIKTSKQQVFVRKDILEVLSMQAYSKQSKIDCNAIYWINAVKACFDEHTKNTKSN